MTGLQLTLTIPGMVGSRKQSTPSAYRKQFIDRLHSLRVASKLSAKEVAAVLGVTLDTYQRWEKRTYIPHNLIIPFCDATGADPYFLLTGVPFQIGRVLPDSKERFTRQ